MGIPLGFLVGVFIVGYLLMIFEFYVKVNKTAVSLFLAVACWMIYFTWANGPPNEMLGELTIHVSKASQIIFFLLGAMTLVELVDSHKGFKIITDSIYSPSKRKMLWTVAIFSFFLSSILDNLTTTILMISLLRKMIPRLEERIVPACIIVIAANAGGAWTPIGDITTTMLWIDGQLSSIAVIKALFLPSIISLLVPLAIFSFTEKGKFTKIVEESHKSHEEPYGRLIFYLGVCGLIFVPIFKAWTGLPPFMGMLISLAVLWLVTDILHHNHHEKRHHLRVPFILTKIDTSSVLFFLGILLSMNALETAGLLDRLAHYLSGVIQSQATLATLIGIISAFIDNVPLVAATMGMYPLSEFPMDSSLWHMIAYAAGTGGSLLIIGSASGIALMGMEKIHFFTYAKKATIPVLVGYLAGMGCYLLFS
ncbi:MAG: sodium:proton antiporter NhaD [Chlamydiales bacterium]|nr:sodium:proton antiporter NhaD [Chlamydiales bacterium]